MSSAAESPPQSSSAVENQALVEARRCLESHYLRRGDSWIVKNWGALGEFKEPTFRLTATNTAADKLNGYEYRAQVSVAFKARRYFNTDFPANSHWEDWEPGGEAQFFLVRRNGVWECKWEGPSEKPSSADIPPG
jgi:hypothetical protein